MRNTLLILMISAFQSLAVTVYAQNTLLSLDVKNSTVKEVLQQIEQKSEFYFLYNSELVDVQRKIDLTVENEKIDAILSKIFNDGTVDVLVRDRHIVLTAKAESSSQQGKKVSGRVTDASGVSLPGVSVVVKGTTIGVITDTDGKYALQNIPENGVLVFSFVGMKAQEIVVGNKGAINITLSEETIGIEEVVAIGYGSVKKSDLTGAISSVSGTELKQTPISNLAQGLQGRSPGVLVRQTNAGPGGSVSVRIRGGNSINAGNDPLYVIDGFIGPSNLNSINPQDIESIEILKDASSTAIYGARAANGVVLVTTKRGKSGKTVIDIDSYYGIQSYIKTIDVMNAEQYSAFNVLARGVNTATTELTSDWKFKADPTVNTDWQKLLLQNAPIQNHTVRVSGGNEQTRYMVSGEYFDQQGIAICSNFNRFSLRSNLDFTFAKGFIGGLNFTGSYSILKDPINENVGYNPIINAALMPSALPKNFRGPNPYDTERHLFVNTLEEVQNTTNENIQFKNMATLFAEIELFKGIKFRSSIGIDISFGKTDVYANHYTDIGSVLEDGTMGRASMKRNDNYMILNENTLSYSKSIKKHSLNAVAGFTWQTAKNTGIWAQDSNFELDELSYYNMFKSDPLKGRITGNSSFTKEQMVSFLGRVNYNYNDLYLFTVSGRSDGSSKFGENNQFAFFPSAAFAWRINREEFMQDLNSISNLKLRFSIGKTGNQGINAYSKQAVVNSMLTAFGTAYYQGAISNPNLKWESTTQYDFGTDLGLFKNTLTLSADAYYKKTKDLLISRELSGTTGFGANLENFGSISNKGIEIEVGYHKEINKLKLETSISFSKNKGKILDLPKDSTSINGLKLIKGQEVGVFWGLQTDGLIRDSDLGSLYQTTLRSKLPGDLKFIDKNNDGILSQAKDETILGSPQPDFIIGWNASFVWKGFDFNLFIQGVFGNEINNEISGNFIDLVGWRGKNTLAALANPDLVYPAPNAIYPAIGRAHETTAASDWTIEDGSYIRFRTISLGYLLNSRWLKRTGMSRFRLYGSLNNFFTLTNYSGIDPEVTGSGVLLNGVDDGSKYPTSKSVTFGVNISF